MLKMYSRYIALILFLVIFICVVIFLLNINNVNRDAPKVENGYIDLSQWNFIDDGIVALDGTWEFYNEQLLESKDFVQTDKLSPTHMLHVPGTWGALDGLNNIPKRGYGTYRVVLNVSPIEQVLALAVDNIRYSGHLFIDGNQYQSTGNPSASSETFEPSNTSYQVYFQPKGEQIEIIVQIANYHFSTSGIINSLVVGDAQQMSERNTIGSGVDMALVLLIIFLGLYCFILFFVGKQNKSYVYIGLYLLTLGLNNAMYNGKILQRVLANLPYEIIYEFQEFVQFTGGILLFFFITSFEIKLMSKKLMHILFTPIYVYLSLITLTPYEFHIRFKFFVAVYLIVIPLIIFIRLIYHYIKLHWNKTEESGNKLELLLVIMATLSLIGYVTTSYMFTENLLPTDVLNKIFTLCFTLLMLLVMTLRYARIQEQTEQLTKQLMLSNELKDEFLLNTSSELKTPLHGIQNVVNYLLTSQPKSEEEMKQQFWFIRDTSMKLSLLVNDLIDVSLLRDGKLKLNISVVDLKVAVDIVIDLLSLEITGKELSIVNNVPHHTYVEVDEMRLRQVLYNLVYNSIKYTKKGIVMIHAKANEGSVSIWIKDTGVGIAPESFNAIFVKYEQIHKSLEDNQSNGLGVGLYLSRKLVMMMNGQLIVEWSEIGKGTHMKMTLPKALHYEGVLPMKQAENGLERFELQSRNLDYINGHDYTILVIDDEGSQIHSILPLLKQIQCNVLTAFSAREGLQKIENFGQVDLIVLDMIMPEMSGLELCKLLREKYSILELPIIFTTAKESTMDIIQAFRSGANDYVTKPFEADTLIARIQTFLAMKHATNEAISNEIAFHHAQIKPHFLYNAISSVIAFCYEDGEKAAHLLTSLSKYLRYILDVDRTDLVVPLKRELELIDAYIDIEKARFGEHLKFEVDIDESILGINVPFLSIQPFVENAIRHGIFNNIEEGIIRLEIKQIADMVLIKIMDNGKGIANDKLEKLRKGQSDGASIAITNIYKRITLMPKASIRFDSELNYGTTVTIILPNE